MDQSESTVAYRIHPAVSYLGMLLIVIFVVLLFIGSKGSWREFVNAPVAWVLSVCVLVLGLSAVRLRYRVFIINASGLKVKDLFKSKFIPWDNVQRIVGTQGYLFSQGVKITLLHPAKTIWFNTSFLVPESGFLSRMQEAYAGFSK